MVTTSPPVPRPGRRGSSMAGCGIWNMERSASSAKASPNATGSCDWRPILSGRCRSISRWRAAGVACGPPPRGWSAVSRWPAPGGLGRGGAAGRWELDSPSTTCWLPASAGRGTAWCGRAVRACRRSMQLPFLGQGSTAMRSCSFRNGSRWNCSSTPATSPRPRARGSKSAPSVTPSSAATACCGLARLRRAAVRSKSGPMRS